MQIYSVIKLHVSGFFSAHHQEFSAVLSWLCLEAIIKTCMKLTSAERTAENSWWWAEKKPEIC